MFVRKCPECGKTNLIPAGAVRWVRLHRKPPIATKKRWLCLDCGLHTVKAKRVKR